MENLHKHLEFIQLTIVRMAANSFLIKGWSVTLVSALFLLSAKDADSGYTALALFPAIIFWGLDGFFLWQEKRFRLVYDIVRKRGDDTDFAMYYPEIEALDSGWLSASFSKTLIPFHGAILIAIGSVFLFGR